MCRPPATSKNQPTDEDALNKILMLDRDSTMTTIAAGNVKKIPGGGVKGTGSKKQDCGNPPTYETGSTNNTLSMALGAFLLGRFPPVDLADKNGQECMN